MRADVALVVEIALVGDFRAPGPVVHHQGDGIDLALHRGRHLAHRHAEAAVAHQRDHGALRRRHLGAEPGGVGKADVAAIERRDERRHDVARQLVGRLQAGGAGVEREQRVARRDLAQFRVDGFRVQRLGAAARDFLASLPQLLPVLHEFFVARAPRRGSRGNRVHHVGERPRHRARVRGDAELDRVIAAERERIDVDLHDARRGRDDLVTQARRVEAEPRAEGEYQVRLAQEAGRHRVAARARAACVERMVHRRDVGMPGGIGDGKLELFGELQQSASAAPPLDAGAGVNDG